MRRVIAVRGEMTLHARVPAPVRLRPREATRRSTGETGGDRSSSDDLCASTLVTSVGASSGTATTASARSSTSPPARARSSVLEKAGDGPLPALVSDDEAADAFEDTVRFWRGWLAHSIYTRPLARDGEPLGADAEAAHVPPDGRDRRRAHHEPPGAARRRAQLGLPLHLDPRRRVLALRAPAPRVHRGGRGLHALAHRPLPRDRPAAATGRSRSCTASTAAPTSRRRCSTTSRATRGSAPGADRQRRRRPAPARHLRRADRLGLPVQQVRRADLVRRLDGPREGRSSGCARTGTGPTRGSGRCAAAASTSRTRG